MRNCSPVPRRHGEGSRKVRAFGDRLRVSGTHIAGDAQDHRPGAAYRLSWVWAVRHPTILIPSAAAVLKSTRTSGCILAGN
jgi:hypothetical protein